LDFLGNRGRIHSLRLHPHAETDKKVTHRKVAGGSFGRTSARLFRSRRRKGAVIGRAAAYRSSKKLGRPCDPLLTRDKARRNRQQNIARLPEFSDVRYWGRWEKSK
jgi:hypothetical protein